MMSMVKKSWQFLVVTGLLCTALSAQAKTNFFNADGALVMKSLQPKPKIYQIWNTSTQKISLDVVNKATGVQAGYASTLDPKSASAFVYSGTKPNLIWSCQVPAVGTALTAIACNNVLKVTNYPTRSLKLKAETGNYWLLENKPQADFKASLKAALASKH